MREASLVNVAAYLLAVVLISLVTYVIRMVLGGGLLGRPYALRRKDWFISLLFRDPDFLGVCLISLLT